MNWKIGCTEIIKEDSKYTLYFLYSKNCGSGTLWKEVWIFT
ncbi:hypothetical protein LEP1GSC021_3948 [Leptospira noguchii str. 1993005606]|uniref:Uncharacterized protein n=1 Tax=Leptospira noguchii str. 2001034031 TaxID=1193053 RepID=M6Y2Y2_9LEPT|nr:hypothetical protein [Leptospira noguchii]EMO88025.1 hypothetical protein LEP1GSC024_3299 [Leptospira noguchii str. 2001034031]EPE85491.1 hypothetical protein LEP1GSC021_3948 [Leptospira noguchii str. 1993005606]